jgi:hypothetical protein
MTRGKKPVAAIAEAKTFAERMGYRWQENSHPDLAYDLFIFKPGAACIVRVRQTRFAINPDPRSSMIVSPMESFRAGSETGTFQWKWC